VDLLNDKQKDIINRTSIETVQKQKHEYQLVGRFLRRMGLKLFSYKSSSDEIKEVIIEYGDTIYLRVDKEGNLYPVDLELEKCTVDTRLEYFECLNINNAKKRVSKYKRGEIVELCNLRKPNKEHGIKFY